MLVLGVAYKRDIDDYRESPALTIIEQLEHKGAQVDYYDPHVPHYRHEADSRTGIASLATLADYDLAVITTDHKAFDYADIVARARILVDTRNACKQVQGDRSRVYPL